MHVVVDLQCCQNDSRHRGIGRYALELTKAIAAHPRAPDLSIFLSDRYPRTINALRTQLDGFVSQSAIHVCRMPERTASGDPDNAWRTRAAEILRAEFLAELAPDIVFVPSLFEGFWDNIVVSVEPSPFKNAITIHDFIPFEEPDRYIPAQRDRDAYARKIQSLRRADLLVAISDFTARSAIDLLHVPSDRVIVAPNGVDERFTPKILDDQARGAILSRLGISKPFIFNTSPLEYRKNIEGLIAGFASMAPAIRADHQLVISGKMDAYALNYLQGLMVAEGLSADHLVLPGYVSDNDLVSLYRLCELFCFPSLSEGFGLPPLEAMACGAPVVCSNTSALPEVVGRADLLVDPNNPRALGEAMERILTDSALRDELRAFGPARAAEFPWERTATLVIESFERLVAVERTPQATNASSSRLNMAIVVSGAVDRPLLAAIGPLVAELSLRADITLIPLSQPSSDCWLMAICEVRDAAWLERSGAKLDVILYVASRWVDDVMAGMMAALPGIVLQPTLTPLLEDTPTRPLPRGYEKALVDSAGLGLLWRVASGDAAPDEIAQAIAGLASRLGCEILTGVAGGSPLPLLAIAPSPQEALSFRERAGVPPHASLVVAFVAGPDAAAHVIQHFRTASDGASDRHLVIYPLSDEATAKSGFVHSVGNVLRLDGPILQHYLGMMSAADLVVSAGALQASVRDRLKIDAPAIAVPWIDDALLDRDLADKIRKAVLPADRIRPLAGPLLSVALDAWAGRVIEVANGWRARPPKLLQRLARQLPASVRGAKPTSQDVRNLARSVASSENLSREPLILLDLTAFAAKSAKRRLDAVTRARLRAVLEAGGVNMRPVWSEGEQFITANQFVCHILGLQQPALTDDIVFVQPHDRIIGVDLFHSFGEHSGAALRSAQAHGAVLLYVIIGQPGLAAGKEPATAALIMAAANEARTQMQTTIAAPGGFDLSVLPDPQLQALIARGEALGLNFRIIAVEAQSPALAELIPEAPPAPSMHSAWHDIVSESSVPESGSESAAANFAVMGHLLGSYSLAIINRAIATTLEENAPGRVRFLPYETDPIAHTEGVPPKEQPLMIELCARPRPPQGHEVVICQHWPILPPPKGADLALALFPWEESHVPYPIIRRLDDGYDAVIAPARSVADALVISGLRKPIATIGQPVDVAAFLEIGSNRTDRPVRRFLHVSSCFERKGVDVLLAAWARAFNDRDGVELVIKTFPNPHNNVAMQVEELRRRHPRLAPIEIVNRDAESNEMPSFYANADVMVLPTRGEGYNLPALEAMAAGLPLIVTGHGGHRDFCGPDEARLLAFRFARSKSHVGGSHSMWAEPDEDDLVRALQEYADPGQRSEIAARCARARAAAFAESNRSEWMRRLQFTVRSLREASDASVPRVGWATTWEVRCGIAQYSSYLIERMSVAARNRLTVICDHRTETEHPSVSHTAAWPLVGDKADIIVTEARDRKMEALVIQHQDGLISWEQLGRLGNHPLLTTMVSIVILHNARNLNRAGDDERSIAISGMKRFDKVIVHNIDDLNFLTRLGLSDNLGLLPHGAFTPEAAPWPRQLDSDASPIIGCHGFFFRHKGIDKLIRAAALLRKEWPRLRLRLVNARFPDPGHDQTIDEAREIARQVGMEDAIEWHLDFLPIDQIETLLSGCDVLALPYGESDDSASGAVRTALATMVPLVATRVQIFAELDDAVARADSNDPAELARVIGELLRSPRERREVQARMHSWLQAHDWEKIAQTLEGMIHGLVRTRRLGWQYGRERPH